MIFYGVLFFLPFFATFFIRRRFDGIVGFALCTALSFLLMVTPVITMWLANDYFLEQKIVQLDRNGDGFWSGDEKLTWSEEDKANLEHHIGDGGRNVFSAIIFPVFSACYSFIVVSTWWLVVYFKRRRLVPTCT